MANSIFSRYQIYFFQTKLGLKTFTKNGKVLGTHFKFRKIILIRKLGFIHLKVDK